MGGRLRLLAAFLGGVAIAALVFGIVLLADSGGDDSSNDSVVLGESPTPTAATPTDDRGEDGESEASLTSEDCRSAADIYEEVRDSVVEINVSAGGGGFFGGPISGAGSGVVIDEDGHILTNNHVVDGADSIEVRFADGQAVNAEFVGSDPANDLAVIKVDPLEHNVEPATLGDSSELRVGDPVLAIGNPFNLEGTLTQGIVSALDRTYVPGANTRPLRGMIQTDAAINPGNSGGPLLNCRGEVVGINTLLENPSGDGVNVGVAFAVAIDTATSELDALKAGETVQHPWLGIAGQDVTPVLAGDLGLSVDSGVYVTLVTEGSPADDAGLIAAFTSEESAATASDLPPGGDVIVSADGEDVEGIDELAEYLAENKSPGDTVELEVLRDGEILTVTAVLADWPS